MEALSVDMTTRGDGLLPDVTVESVLPAASCLLMGASWDVSFGCTIKQSESPVEESLSVTKH